MAIAGLKIYAIGSTFHPRRAAAVAAGTGDAGAISWALVATRSTVVRIPLQINADRRIPALRHARNAFTLAFFAQPTTLAYIATCAAVVLVAIKVGTDTGNALRANKALTITISTDETTVGVASVVALAAMQVAGLQVHAIGTTQYPRRWTAASAKTLDAELSCTTGIATRPTVSRIGRVVDTLAVTFLPCSKTTTSPVAADLIIAASVVASAAVGFVVSYVGAESTLTIMAGRKTTRAIKCARAVYTGLTCTASSSA